MSAGSGRPHGVGRLVPRHPALGPKLLSESGGFSGWNANTDGMIPRPRWLSLLLVGLCAATAALARDAFVLYSGGGTPLTNNYSQYLQARAVSAFLLDRYPQDSVWIFFGAGNREGEAPVFSDTRRQFKRDGALVESWLPGVLPHNRRADKATFLDTLRDEVLPTVRDGGTLYLFVGDHGTQQKEGLKESLITLWQMKRTETGGWRTDPQEELSVSELRDVIAAGIGRGRVVFCMTQCHSGGFHFLGAPRSVAPDPSWFEGFVPAWAMPATEGTKLPAAAGFTATDEDSLAAGCDPDPDPDRWAGYERYVPEFLLGIDLFTHEPQRAALASYAEAHEQAVLVDQTIDKPRSTSEVFLERWASVIERLAEEENLVTPVLKAVADYQTAVEAGLADGGEGALWAERRAQFARFTARLAEQCPSAADKLRSGTRPELEALFARPEGRPSQPGSGRRAVVTPLAADWKEKLRPVWKEAVERGEIAQLEGHALEFERYLLAQEERGRDVMFPRSWQNPMLNDLFWRSSYAIPGQLDPAKAEAVTRWGATRRAEIAAWAATLESEELRRIGERMKPRAFQSGPRPLRPAIAAERALFYRRTLAAWRFLQQVDAQEALAQLEQLIELERTPLPAGRK